jgi:L-ascorbate metabolism protein UlaG (beta-lactamase superfamily)
VRGAGKKDLKGVLIEGTDVFHDTSGGKDRGTNTIFKVTVDGMNIVHLGDLGHPLSDQAANNIGAVDIVFVPVGGYFTIDAAAAETVIEKLNPKIVVPMHFKTEKCGFPIASVNEFTKNKQVEEFDSEFEMNKESLPGIIATYVLTPTN